MHLHLLKSGSPDNNILIPVCFLQPYKLKFALLSNLLSYFQYYTCIFWTVTELLLAVTQSKIEILALLEHILAVLVVWWGTWRHEYDEIVKCDEWLLDARMDRHERWNSDVYWILMFYLPNKFSCGKKYRHPYYISPIEIGLLWAKIEYLKRHSKALSFGLQIDMK